MQYSHAVQPSVRVQLPSHPYSDDSGRGAESARGHTRCMSIALPAILRIVPPAAGMLRLQATYVRERDGVIAPALILQLHISEGHAMPAAYTPADIAGEADRSQVGVK